MAGYSRFGFICYHYIVSNLAADFVVTICMVHNYELETPIVTDISTLIDDDFLRNIEVEAGGSVTFKNSNDNYRIPVPSEEEYVVKLSEVGGNV